MVKTVHVSIGESRNLGKEFLWHHISLKDVQALYCSGNSNWHTGFVDNLCLCKEDELQWLSVLCPGVGAVPVEG